MFVFSNTKTPSIDKQDKQSLNDTEMTVYAYQILMFQFI